MLIAMERGTVVDEAREAMRLADFDAGRAAPVAQRAAERALRERHHEAASIAERAWGRSLLQCGDVDRALGHLRRSIALADRAQSPTLAGEARIPLAAALVQRGRPGQAVQEIDTAVRNLNGAGNARARAQRADILHQIGRLDEALPEYQAAIPLLRRAGDLLNLQRTLVNRGILHTERHAFAAAESDLLEADRLARELGRHLAVGIIAENLGFLETLRGDVPAALASLKRAEQTIGELGGQLGPVFLDRSELLLSVGLRSEAAADAARAIAAFERERRGIMVPGARLLLAQAAFLGRDWPTALDQALRARREFRRQHRAAWAELAQLTVLRTRLASADGSPVRGREVTAMVDTLAGSSWPAAALEARLVAARLSELRGRQRAAREHLARASSARRRGPAVLRARCWYAEALLRHGIGDRPGATRAVRAGLRILDDHGASLGATDLRVHSAVHRAELTELGLRLAFRDGRPHRVFEWAERGRASRLLHRPVLPPEDPELAGLLAELRATAWEADRAREEGRGIGALGQRQLILERRIRDHHRLLRGEMSARPAGPVKPSLLGSVLGDAALVEFVQLDGLLHALTLVDGRLRMRRIGPLAPLADLIDRLPFALHRLARPAGRAHTRSAALALLTEAAGRIDATLLGELVEVHDRSLIVVPTGPLHSLPWSVLPSCVGRPVAVSPSATLWHAARSLPDLAPHTVAVTAGPGLAGAREEAAAVAAIHHGVPMMDGGATVDAVLKALTTSGLMHLAAHGRLSTDNPLFSSLRLHDGPLVVYDLERLPRVPHTVVLAACDSGRSVVCTGDELLGLAATFIAQGAAQLVASVVPVPDAETTPLMVALHQRLAAGEPPALALAGAQQAVRGQGPAAMAAAAGFVCLGDGMRPLCVRSA